VQGQRGDDERDIDSTYVVENYSFLVPLALLVRERQPERGPHQAYGLMIHARQK
jgi:hypothetical protein